VEVGTGQEGVVVEHLLEVRDEPDIIHRVAGKAATDLVVDPAVEGHFDRFRFPTREQEVEGGGRGEFGGGAEASRFQVGKFEQCRGPVGEEVGVEIAFTGADQRDRTQAGSDIGSLRPDLVAPLCESLLDGVHDHHEAGHSAR